MHRVENKEGGNPALTRTIAAWPRYPLTSNAGDSSGGASSDGDASPNAGGANPSGGGASPSDGGASGDASPSDVASAPLPASDVPPRRRW